MQRGHQLFSFIRAGTGVGSQIFVRPINRGWCDRCTPSLHGPVCKKEELRAGFHETFFVKQKRNNQAQLFPRFLRCSLLVFHAFGAAERMCFRSVNGLERLNQRGFLLVNGENSPERVFLRSICLRNWDI